MPLSDLITDEMEDEELERARGFEGRWRDYEGEHPDSLPVVQGTEGRPDTNDNVKYNVSGMSVDKGVSFLFGGIDQEIVFGLQEDAPDPAEADEDGVTPDARGTSPDEEWLQAAWAANSKKTLLANIATNGGVCGHYFVRLYEEGAKLGQEYPRVVNLDPAYVTPVYAEDDYEVVLGYKIQFPTIRGQQKVVRRTLIEPNNMDVAAGDNPREALSWLVTDEIAVGEAGFQPMGEPEVWDYDFAPILDGQNLPRPNEYWGKSDLDGGVVDLNYSMNRALSSMQRILRLHGHPKPFASGVTPEQIAILIQGVDRIITLPDGVKLDQLEMKGDLASSIEFFRQLKSAFHETAKNPQVDPEKLGSIGGLSGVALRILYQPLLEQTGTKRGTYGDFLADLNRRLLVLGRIVPSPVTIAWPNPIPFDFKETAEGLVMAKELGLSQETALGELGFDPDLEEERRARDSVPASSGLGGILDGAGFNGGGAL